MKTIYLILCSCFLLPLAARAGYESRTWTDSTGKFKVEATLAQVEGDKVSIKKADGKFLTIAKSKLSKKDRDYLEKVATEDPFAGDTGSSDIGQPTRSASTRRGAAPKGSFAFGTPGGDVFDSKPIPVNLRFAATGGITDTSWTYDADPASEVNLNLKPRNITFRIGELPWGARASEGGMVVYGKDELTKVLSVINIVVQDKSRRVSVVFFGDLATGKTSSVYFDREVELLGVSPSGTKAMFRENVWEDGRHSAFKNFIHIAEIKGERLERLAAYEPFADDSVFSPMRNSARNRQPGPRADDDKLSPTRRQERDVRVGTWIDDKHILVSAWQCILVMNIESGEAVWQKSGVGIRSIVLSPGRKYCLVPDPHAIHAERPMTLVECLTGTPVGILERTRVTDMLSYGFSPDGTRIAAFGEEGLLGWDATTGKFEESFVIGKDVGGLRWLTDRYLLAGGRLVDMETRVPIWQYDVLAQDMFYGGYFWFLKGSGRDDRQLFGVKLPHATALRVSNVPDKDRYCVCPGMEVSLHIESSVHDGRAEIEARMRKMLEENGLTVKSGAPLSLVLSITREKELAVRYTFAARAPETVTYCPSRFRVEFRQAGKILWGDWMTVFAGPLDDLQNRSLQSAVDESLKAAVADHKGWFLEVKLPKKVIDPDKIGRSIIGRNGIRDE